MTSEGYKMFLAIIEGLSTDAQKYPKDLSKYMSQLRVIISFLRDNMKKDNIIEL